MKAKLKLLSWDGGEPEMAVEQGSAVIGRAPDCDYQVESPLVSRHHCEVVVERERVLVRDMGSRNGTFVNGHPVRGMCLLDEGDLLSVAASIFQVHILETGMDQARHFCARAREAVTRLVSHEAHASGTE